MGISILIVDDDKLLVEKLEETVYWSGIGIDMVFTANNIRQAKKLLEVYPIEMLLCDIDMPQGNGLELLEWIRYKKLDIECTFLSSYANFAYAQMALKLSRPLGQCGPCCSMAPRGRIATSLTSLA